MQYEKLSPALASAVADFEVGGRLGLASHDRSLGLVSVDYEVPRPPRIVVFLDCDEGLRANAFAAEGVEINQPQGSLRTGIVPFAALDRLTEDPAVQRITSARRLRPLMDIAKEKVGVNAFRSSSGLTGSGVIVGTVDTGIDITNQAFAGRILRIWDQNLPGNGVPEGPYGVELRGRQLRTSRDTIGHGTHVAGIAASADPNYEGVAPGASLLVVSTDLMTAHLADAVRYIFRIADEMRRPAVVNMSLGGHGDAHDGTDPLSRIIDAESGPGRIVCCAAGNEGMDNIHAQVRIRRGSTQTIACAIAPPAPGQQPRVATFNGWYDGGDQLDVAVVPPSGPATPYQQIITSAPPQRDYQTPHGFVRVITPGPDPANGDHNFFIQIIPSPTPPPVSNPHAWRIRVRGRRVANGTLDVWVVDETVAQFTGPGVVDNMKIGSPGCASGAVTVGAYVTRNEWEDIFGNPHEIGLAVDTIAEFSSEGPRRDGVRKPDVVAPGAMIVSALSVHAPTPQPVIVDDSNRAMAGTSQACPFISGLVALLLEQDPALGPDEVKRILREHSSIPRRPAGRFDNKWGYGLIDATDLGEDRSAGPSQDRRAAGRRAR
jgi:subtilisin family serine protease